jgi:AraC family transcriptional regulator, arabinose operon regulatory protein
VKTKHADEHVFRGDDPAWERLPLHVVASGVSHWRAGQGFSRSHTPFWGLELVIAGVGWFEQDGVRHDVGPGDVFILRRGSANSYGPSKGGTLTKRYLQIRGLAADQVVAAAGLSSVDVVRGRPGLGTLFESLHILLSAARTDYPVEASVLAYRLVAELGRSGDSATASMAPLLEWIEQNLHEPLTCADCARRAGVTVVHLNRLLRPSLGMSLKSYVQRRKVALASHLLAETGLPVKQVAYRSGFSDPLYFSGRFRLFTGASPKAYRTDARRQAAFEGRVSPPAAPSARPVSPPRIARRRP